MSYNVFPLLDKSDISLTTMLTGFKMKLKMSDLKFEDVQVNNSSCQG